MVTKSIDYLLMVETISEDYTLFCELFAFKLNVIVLWLFFFYLDTLAHSVYF